MARSRKRIQVINEGRAGGYRLKQKKQLIPVDSKPEVVPQPIKQRKVPEGLLDVLKAKHELVQALKTQTTLPYTVSVDLNDNEEWYLTIRGYMPPYTSWNGYEIKTKKSSFIKNPKSRMNYMMG